MKKYIQISILIIMGLAFHSEVFAVKHIVHVGNYYFNPSVLNVSVGDTVRFQWDAGIHTTTSGIIPAGAEVWDEDIKNSSQVFDYHVEFAGVYNYVCTPHAAMGMAGSFTASAPAVGIGENNGRELQIYPNPSRGFFKVMTGNTLEEETEISLFDISGKTLSTELVYHAATLNFDLSDSPRGYYFIRLKSESGTIVRRIVIVD